MKGMISLISGVIAIISGTLCLALPSVALIAPAIIFWLIGAIAGSRAWNQSKQKIALVGFILSLIGFIEALIYVFINLI